MAKCNICLKEIEEGIGISYILSDGKIMHFCSSKCRKTYQNKRKLKRLKWTKPEKNIAKKK